MKLSALLLFFLLFTLFLFVSFNRDSKVKAYTYQSEVWADKAGYHIYLPYLLVYCGDARTMPDSIDIKTGNGFTLDTLSGKVFTKYTYGTSLLQSPFYIVCLSFFRLKHQEFDPFTLKMQRSINMASAFYSLLGLCLLYLFLKYKGHSRKTTWLGLSAVFLSTNLLYYSLFECGMSHVYSFFAFTLLLWSLTRQNMRVRQFWQGLSVGLIIAIRPVNIIYIPIILAVISQDTKDYGKCILSFFNLISIALIAIIIFPQLLYWKLTFGSWLFYSYQNEGFTNLFRPPILQFLFSTNNGLIWYAPILIFSLVGVFILMRINRFQAYSFLLGFILFVWVSSSWWIWNYGCSYGCRPFVELLSVYCIPLCVFIERTTRTTLKFSLSFVLILLVVSNIKFIYSSDNCWFYGDWDFAMYYKTLLGPTR